jgi:hypothetical protein
MISEIKSAWSWLGVEPAEILATNAFGNVLFKDADSRFWRLCPEELACTVVAETRSELDQLLGDPNFQVDWEMTRLVTEAHRSLGTPTEGRCYCLKVAAPLGGTYTIENIATISTAELIAFSGYLASQIHDLPDGAKIRLVTE